MKKKRGTRWLAGFAGLAVLLGGATGCTAGRAITATSTAAAQASESAPSTTAPPSQSASGAAAISQSAPAQAAAPTVKAEAYAGWKAFTSPQAGYTLKYPSTWLLRTNRSGDGTENVHLTSPGGLEITAWSFTKQSAYGTDAFKMNPTGSCGAQCLATNSKTGLSIPNYGPASVIYTTAGAGGGTINEILMGTAEGALYIGSPTHAGFCSTFTGVFQGRSQEQNTVQPAADFAAENDVKDAEMIYRSLSY